MSQAVIMACTQHGKLGVNRGAYTEIVKARMSGKGNSLCCPA